MSITRQSLETYTAQMGGHALGFAAGVLIARLLGPAGKGLCTWLMLWPALVVVVGRLGLDTAVTYYGRAEPESRPGLRRLLAPVALSMGLSLGIVFFGIAFLGYRNSGMIHTRLLLLSLAVGPAALYVALVGGLLLGCERVRLFNVLTLLVPILHTAVLFLFWSQRPEAVSVTLAIVSWTAAYAVSAVVAFVASRRAVPERGVYDRKLIRRSIRYGLCVHLGGLAAHMNLRLTHFLIGAFAGASALGIYSVAVSGAEILAYFAVAESLVLLPAASVLPATQRWNFVMRRGIRTLLLFATATGIALFTISPAVRLLFGNEFLSVIPAFYLLLPGMGAHSVNLLLGSGLRASGEPLPPTRAAWLGVAVTIPIAPFVLSHWGVMGAAFLFTTAQMSSAGYLVRAAYRSRSEALKTFPAPSDSPPQLEEDSHAPTRSTAMVTNVSG